MGICDLWKFVLITIIIESLFSIEFNRSSSLLYRIKNKCVNQYLGFIV